MKKIFLSGLFVLFSTFVFAQTWEELNKQIEELFAKGEFEKAIPIGQKAIEVAKRDSGEYHDNYTASLNNLATLYEKMGQFDKAEPLFIKAMEILKTISGEENADYAGVVNALGLVYHRLSQFNKAELFYIKAKEIQRKVLGEKDPDYAISLNNLANLYSDIGQYEKAELLYIQAAEIFKIKMGVDDPSYGSIQTNLADLYIKMAQFDKAETLLIQTREIRKRTLGEEHSDYAIILNTLGALYRTMGQYKKAEPLYNQAIEIRKKKFGEYNSSYALSLNNLAVLYKDMGQYEKAKPLFIRAKEIQNKILGAQHPNYANTLNNLADLYSAMGEYVKAEFFLTTTKNIELNNMRTIFNMLSEKEKGNYLLNKNKLVELNNSFLYDYHSASPSFFIDNFNLHIILKSLILSETNNLLQTIINTKDTAIQKLFLKWQANRTVLAKQYSLPISNRKGDLKIIEAETENIEKKLNRQSEDFRKQQDAIHISIKEVRKNLQSNELAIEFVKFRLYNKKWTDSTVYAAYILNKKDSVPYFVPLFEEGQLQQLLDSSGKTTTSTAKIFYRGVGVNDKNTKQGGALYKLVWQPLEPYLKGINKISYSPAGKLFGIAFHALPVGNDSLLMEKYQLQQYTSTRQVALRNTENQNVKPTSIILFGDPDFSMDSIQLTKQRTTLSDSYASRSVYTPSLRGATNSSWPSLPGSAEEITTIKQLFDANKIADKSFTQTAASEENLKALSGNSPQILHIATHGFFLPDPTKLKKDITTEQGNVYTLANDPLLRTGLILAGGNYAWSGKIPVEGVEDGIVTAYEIAQLNLSNTELVVLSACETALGDVKGSEGVFGLQRAFKMAGAKKMLVSLWKVPDKETAELMTAFYSYWINGETINDAFAKAQADMRKKYSPFYWAAFVLVE
jgi:CHAT domain-containing protein/tetratricopeptide (TPR) repeat protein